MGGWDSSSYAVVTTTGKSGSVIIPGDVENSILAQRIQGLQGNTMPPTGQLPQSDIQIILDWIAGGALDN